MITLSSIQRQGGRLRSFMSLSLFLDSLATLQVVWFYLLHTSSALHLVAFENGMERTPFQHRLLMVFPLRWAHQSRFMAHAASTLEQMHGWLPAHITPEGLVQALVDLLCVMTTGIIARRLYLGGTRTRTFTPFIYPLTLVLVVFTYTLLTSHALRFVYDLPALAFFSIGLYLIYFRHHPAWFAMLFIIATMNRETTLLLLPLYAVTECIRQSSSKLGSVPTAPLSPAPPATAWSRLYAARTLLVTLPLAAFWIGWHLFAVHHFAANPSAAAPRLLLNLGVLLCPLSWPQVASACGFLCPLVFVNRSSIADPTLRLWVWLLPAWFAFMLFYGLILEPRVFGELIPLIACTAALIAEESILQQARLAGTSGTTRILPFKLRRLS